MKLKLISNHTDINYYITFTASIINVHANNVIDSDWLRILRNSVQISFDVYMLSDWLRLQSSHCIRK